MINEILELMDKDKFTNLVEGHIQQYKAGPIEAIVTVCEENSLEVEEVGRLLSPSLLSKLEAEAMDKNYIPRTNKLPI
jgi:hypothetical protein